MSTPRRSQFTATERFEFAEWLHVESLAAILSLKAWSPGRFAFQGGTALHLCYGSPRFSEDLDFLLLDVKDLEGFTQHLSAHLSKAALIRVPGSSVKVTANSHNDTRNPMLFEARFQHPKVMTKLVVKMEFFKTPAPLMSPYQTELRQPRGMHSAYVMQIPGLIPTSTSEEIALDKFHAFPHRAYLKYRDVFDIWWLRHHELKHVDYPSIAPRFDYHRELYNTSKPHELGAKIRERAAQMTAEGLQEEMASHLPSALFKTFTTEKCQAIVNFVRKELETFIYHYERHHGLIQDQEYEMAMSM
jgi:predicted nucleotidyltransferase component of viral defense system